MLRLQRAMSNDLSLRSFIIAATIMVVAVAVRAAIDRVLPDTPPFITLYPAVALAGLLCGPFAGAIAGVTGLLTAIYIWIPPRMSFGMPSLTDCVSIVLFIATSSVVLWAAALSRIQAAAASSTQEALELGLAAGGIGTWEFNLRTRCIVASGTAYALHGLPESLHPTTAEDWLRGIPEEDVAAARAALQTAVADGTLATYTYRISGGIHSNEPRWISARGRVISSGGDRRLLCALVDITEQVRIQDELRRERERLRLALEAGALAVWDFDPASGQAVFDTRYAVTMGFDPNIKSLTREQIGGRIHPDDLARVAAEHEALLARGSDYRIEFRIITPSGGIRWILSQAILIQGNSAYDPGRLVGIIQDITSQKQREEEFEEQAAFRELLVREADHRIKNSLQLVTSLLTVQLRGIETPGAADALREAINRVNSIAASHLALQDSKDLKEVDVAITLKDLCAHFARLHPAVSIVCEPSGSLILDADRAIPLGLVVSEVLTNALRHAFPGRDAGTVAIEAWAESSQLIVRVKDNGVGIQKETGRSGLGSKIIRSLATQLAATIEIDGAPDAGTTVNLRLPIRQREPLRAQS
jgi:PAS domain S-box-containing protein